MFVEEWIYQKLLREYEERQSNYLEMPYVHVPFNRVKSEKFLKTDVELQAYSMPITRILEDNSVKDMTEAIDNSCLVEVCEKMGRVMADEVFKKMQLFNKGD